MRLISGAKIAETLGDDNIFNGIFPSEEEYKKSLQDEKDSYPRISPKTGDGAVKLALSVMRELAPMEVDEEGYCVWNVIKK